jgi:SnoaL-like domain
MLEELQERVARLEDESAIQRLIMSYGPSADAGLADAAAALWSGDGEYDWDAGAEPLRGAAAVHSMLSGAAHRRLIAAGAAHFSGPLLIELDGDLATALNYSLVMRREDDRYYLWRVSAVRWDLQRETDGWRVTKRANRLLDATGGGRDLFGDTLRAAFGKEQQ